MIYGYPLVSDDDKEESLWLSTKTITARADYVHIASDADAIT